MPGAAAPKEPFEQPPPVFLYPGLGFLGFRVYKDCRVYRAYNLQGFDSHTRTMQARLGGSHCYLYYRDMSERYLSGLPKDKEQVDSNIHVSGESTTRHHLSRHDTRVPSFGPRMGQLALVCQQ